VAGAFSQMFDLAFTEMDSFGDEPLSKSWVWAHPQGQKAVRLCFSPHSDPGLSLGPVGGAIDQAASSVFYSFAFMNQIKTGAVREALDRLIERPIFSYGIVNNDTDMEIKKPSGEIGLVDFEYLAKLAPEPFKREWSGGQGIHIHHKFAVVDFDQPHGKVYTGSSNFSPAGESDNGDHMLVIENQRVAAAYAIEALRVFDHLAFRSRMKDAAATKKKSKETAAKKKPKEDPLVLLKPLAFAPPTQNETWFAKFYVKDSQRERDRQTFAQP
jgi:phosphatidylserine/phosphatidylglycerophosphate/cardiolipin synthase-like enzyme